MMIPIGNEHACYQNFTCECNINPWWTFWKDRKESCNETLSPRWEHKIWSIYNGNNSCDSLLAYTQILVNQLERDNRSIVGLYAG